MNTKFIVKAIVSLVFVVVLLLKLEFRFLIQQLSSVHLGYYAVSLLLLMLNMILLAIKYKIVMKPTGIIRSVGRLVQINFICRFYSMFLSSAVGQSVIRWYYTTKDADHRFRFVATIFYERASFLLAIVGFLLISSLYISTSARFSFQDQLFLLTSLILIFLCLYYAYLSTPSLQTWGTRRFLSLYRAVGKPASDHENLIDDALSIYYNQPKTLILSVLLALLWHATFLLRVHFLAEALGGSLTAAQLTWTASLVLLLQSVPLTFNGIGIREGGYAFLFGLQGLPAEKGASLGFLLFTQILIIAIIGGAVNWLSNNR